VATNEQKNTQTGEYTENTSWHNVAAFDKLAEVVRDRVHEGDQILFEGGLTTSNVVDYLQLMSTTLPSAGGNPRHLHQEGKELSRPIRRDRRNRHRR
jgi:hypothetical protein